ETPTRSNVTPADVVVCLGIGAGGIGKGRVCSARRHGRPRRASVPAWHSAHPHAATGHESVFSRQPYALREILFVESGVPRVRIATFASTAVILARAP